MGAEDANAAIRRALRRPADERFEIPQLRTRGGEIPFWCAQATLEHGVDVHRLVREAARLGGECFVSHEKVTLYAPAAPRRTAAARASALAFILSLAAFAMFCAGPAGYDSIRATWRRLSEVFR